MISFDNTQVHTSPTEFRDYFDNRSFPFLPPLIRRRANTEHRLGLRENYHIVNFYYKIDDLRSDVYKRTSVLGKHRSTEQLPHLLDMAALTQDEESMFESLLSETAEEVYEKIYAYSKGIEGFLFDEPTLEEYSDGQTDFSGSVHYVIKHPHYVHEASVKMVDTAILNALVFGVMSKWVEYVMPSENEFWHLRYERARMDVKTKLASVNSRLREISHPF